MKTLSTLVALQSHNMFEINNPWILVLLLYYLNIQYVRLAIFRIHAESFLQGRVDLEAAKERAWLVGSNHTSLAATDILAKFEQKINNK